MATSATIEDLVREEHERINAKYLTLEEMAQVFVRGTNIYAARAESYGYTVRKGIINSVLFKNNELVFNVRGKETTQSDYVISSRNWNLFSSIEDLQLWESTQLDDEGEETETTEGE